MSHGHRLEPSRPQLSLLLTFSMSAPATTLAYESKGSVEETNVDVLEHERHLVETLTGITPPAPVIAVDLDDVLSQTNQFVANCASMSLLFSDLSLTKF